MKEDKESDSLTEMPELRTRGGDKERPQTLEREMDSSLDVQKVYLPVYRLSKKNICATESIKDEKTQ